ncbi:MAG: abhydrolase domain-containing 18, partial [Acidobacteria bacterium]|nr:abhydrolase domain-containing 18 [Acidobacteriota bacterium]
FNMVSSYFGDVVWRAVTTSHIRESLETALDLKTAREVWLSLSPSFYADRVLPTVKRRAMFVSARYDLSFLPDLTDIFIADSRRHGVPHETAYLRCGHYTIGRTPFKYLDAFHILNFFRRAWR